MKCLSTLLLFLFASYAQADELAFSLLTPSQPQPRGAEVGVDLLVLNTGGQALVYGPPAELAATLRKDTESWPVRLQRKVVQAVPVAQLLAAGQFVRIPYVLPLPHAAVGRLDLAMSQQTEAVVVIETYDPASPEVAAPADQDVAASPVLASIERTFSERVGFHGPIYFLYGPKAPTAKFQFSFKYRLIGADGKADTVDQPLRGFYFAYTQRSLWDVDGKSSPFYDTSYMPEVFYEWLAPARQNMQNMDAGFHWLGLQAGIHHESNGEDNADSRSMNLVQVRTSMVFGSLTGWHLLVTPRIYDYLSATGDLPRYRGYGDVTLSVAKNRSTQLDVTTRARFNGKGSVQVDLIQPLSISRINLRVALQLQYFEGYGESLRNYDQRSSVWRAGLSFAR